MAILDPTVVRLSPHFLLSDLMGCASVYARGLPNVFDKQQGFDIRLENGKALCEEALEPILALIGSFSVSYGFISPALSKEIVSYQDWRKPSHHRWDLGAAVDICPHRYVLQSTSNKASNEEGAPVVFALEHLADLPLSRLITYSESPYICIAVSSEEVKQGTVRGAWYENRYGGKAKAKPEFIKYSTPQSRARALEKLQTHGLKAPWAGKGYPTYHGGGRKQLQHIRTSRLTMASDWLFDEAAMREGWKNQPALDKKEVEEAFKLAGRTYDALLRVTGLPRVSIVSAYTSHHSPVWIEGRDWREGDVEFEIVPPSYRTPDEFVRECEALPYWVTGVTLAVDQDRVKVRVSRGAKFGDH